ncbi:MAG: hypothetical protein KAG61_12225 [Bacteriovoracaceae bacterium]|nr:hypothetical protein [Bacteriovoracaceae bacterium]
MKSFWLLSLFICTQVFGSIDARFIDRDEKLLLESISGLERTMSYYYSEIKATAQKVKDKNYILSVSESRNIDEFWERFVDLRISFHALYNTYKNTPQQDPRVDLIRYAALVGLTYPAATIVKDMWENERMRQILDGAASIQIPHGFYMSMQNEIFYLQNKLRKRVEADMDFMLLVPGYDLDQEAGQFEYARSAIMLYRNKISGQIVNTIDLYYSRYKKIRPFYQSFERTMVLKYRNTAYKFKNLFYQNFLKISTWIGDTKIHRIDPDYYNGSTLIKIADAKRFQKKLQTGDILTSRSNWFLSNAFLPGFWPHSFIYLGNSEEFSDFFNNDIETNEFFSTLCVEKNIQCSNFVGFLKKYDKTQKTWNNFLQKDEHGYENVLIESTSEGVHFSSIHHTFLNDYLGALRPKISKLNLARAIYDSFMNFGKEYDFYLDWSTDDRLVCSELVSKSFQSDPRIGKLGIDFNYSISQGMYVEQIMGRIAIPVINIVQKAYDENVLNIRPSQMDFVAFLKGVRETNSAVFANEEEYYQSKDWPKWSFKQK